MTERQLSDLLHEATPDPPSSIDLAGLAGRIEDSTPASRRWFTPVTAAAAVITVVAAAAGIAKLTDSGTEPLSTATATATVGTSPGATTANRPLSSSGQGPSEAQLAWARKLVERWTTQDVSGFVPLGDWEFQQVGTWTDADRPYAAALGARAIVSGIDLATAQPGAATITWADGRTRPTEVLTAKATFDRLLAGGTRCANCPHGYDPDGVKLKPLTVTSAVGSTMRVQTTHGEATIPAWRFSFADTSVAVLQAAIRASAVASSKPTTRKGIPVHSAEVTPDGQTLTAFFTGSPGPASQVCGSDYSGLAVESDRAVGIVVTAVPYRRTTPVACADVGTTRSVTVHLSAPLKDRVVIETAGGTAVPVVQR